MTRPTSTVLPLLLALACLTAPPARAAEPSVAGVWEHKAGLETITFALNPDGTGKIDDEACKYVVQGDRIVITTGDDKVTYSFKIDGDTMTVSGGDLDQPTAFTRKGGPKKGSARRSRTGEIPEFTSRDVRV